MGLRPGIDLSKAALSADEKTWLAKVLAERDEKTAYQRIQATRPQTLGVALTDSPVGLAAWIVEKFQAWSDCGGDPLKRFSMDLLLDNIMDDAKKDLEEARSFVRDKHLLTLPPRSNLQVIPTPTFMQRRV